MHVQKIHVNHVHLEHAIFVYLLFSLHSWLVISVTSFSLSIGGLFQLEASLVMQCQNFINFRHLKSIFIILHKEFVEEGCIAIVCSVLDGKEVYSHSLVR